jgi:hypothetical protein
MARTSLQDIIETLEASQHTIRCQEMSKYLQQLGFEVRDGKKEGHKIFTHDGIPSFWSSSYTCGHGKNPEIKPAYVRKIVTMLRRYEAELTEFLEIQHDR